MKKFKIRKSSGGFEFFAPAKIQNSLIRCGTSPQQAKRIVTDIRSKVYPETTTELIRKLVLQQLKKFHPASAVRYQLSRAVMKLGPTGFPFEKLIGQLYQSEGHSVLLNQRVQGRCGNHEIDVVAIKNGKTTFVECKFHVEPGYINDFKTALYVKGRSDDVSAHHDRFALVTNTKFTNEAFRFGQCAGLDMLSWTEPGGDCLANRLESAGLIPLTALTSIPHKLAQALMFEGIITIRDLVELPHVWKKIAQNPKILYNVQNEIDLLFH